MHLKNTAKFGNNDSLINQFKTETTENLNRSEINHQHHLHTSDK